MLARHRSARYRTPTKRATLLHNFANGGPLIITYSTDSGDDPKQPPPGYVLWHEQWWRDGAFELGDGRIVGVGQWGYTHVTHTELGQYTSTTHMDKATEALLDSHCAWERAAPAIREGNSAKIMAAIIDEPKGD